jgi:hypothetical protein
MGLGKAIGIYGYVFLTQRAASRTKPWGDVLKPSGEDRPLGYVAYGSHGVWPGPGSWVYQDVGLPLPPYN